MKIISIGTDIKILEKDSRVYNRVKEYANFTERYYCFVFTKNLKYIKIPDGNFMVVPVFYKYKFLFFFSLLRAIKKEKIENKGDIVLSSQDPFEVGFFSWLVAKIFKYKLLIQVHTDISSKYFKRESLRNFLQYKLSKFVIKRADSLRVVSSRIKTFLIEKWKLDPRSISVAPIFAGDIATPTPGQEQNLQKENVLLALCRLEKVKNIALAADSFLELVKDQKYSDYRLKIVGSGSQERYLKEKYGKYENIIFENFSNNPQEEYKKAKLFLLTSWYEGWGMTPIESVSCGTPVVMTNVGCANEFIFDNLNGYICNTFKVKDFANTIKKALGNYETFTEEKMQNSLKMLHSKEEYLKILENAIIYTPGGR